MTLRCIHLHRGDKLAPPAFINVDGAIGSMSTAQSGACLPSLGNSHGCRRGSGRPSRRSNDRYERMRQLGIIHRFLPCVPARRDAEQVALAPVVGKIDRVGFIAEAVDQMLYRRPRCPKSDQTSLQKLMTKLIASRAWSIVSHARSSEPPKTTGIHFGRHNHWTSNDTRKKAMQPRVIVAASSPSGLRASINASSSSRCFAESRAAIPMHRIFERAFFLPLFGARFARCGAIPTRGHIGRALRQGDGSWNRVHLATQLATPHSPTRSEEIDEKFAYIDGEVGKRTASPMLAGTLLGFNRTGCPL